MCHVKVFMLAIYISPVSNLILMASIFSPVLMTMLVAGLLAKILRLVVVMSHLLCAQGTVWTMQ